VAAIAASIAAALTRKARRDYPGLLTGTLVAVALSLMSWVGRLAN
jgi:hypothetical protein